MQFSQKIRWLQTKRFTGTFRTHTTLWIQNPLETFFIFTIYQNYTERQKKRLSLIQSDISLKSGLHQNDSYLDTDLGKFIAINKLTSCQTKVYFQSKRMIIMRSKSQEVHFSVKSQKLLCLSGWELLKQTKAGNGIYMHLAIEIEWIA